MNELIERIKALLDQTKCAVGYLEVPDKTEMEYIVFELRRISESDGIETYTLEINVWGKDDQQKVEHLMDGIEDLISRYTDIDIECQFTIHIGANRQSVIDPDKRIKRIREQFEVEFIRRN